MADGWRYETLVNRSHDFVALVNRECVYEYANEAFCGAANRAREEVVGREVREVWGENRFQTRMRSVIDQCLAGEIVEYVESTGATEGQRTFHVRCRPFSEDGGEPTHVLFTSHDITHLTEIEHRLTHYEFIDPVTGLFNRRSLDVILDKELFKAQRSPVPVTHALLVIDLEHLDTVQQSFGLDLADLLLENSGVRVKQTVRDSDFVFRIDGSTLTVLLTGVSHGEDAAIVAEKVVEAICVPYSYEGVDVQVGARLGIAVYPQDGASSRELLAHATTALAEARAGGLDFCLYEQAMHQRAVARVALKSELQRAFESRQFLLHYQPFVDADGHPKGAEALIRWNHPARGLLYPGEFIGLAEETRLITAIDKWALYTACRQLAEWADIPDFFISINVSTRDLLDEYLVEVVGYALERAGQVHPSRLKLELTERISMDDPDRSMDTMRQLEEMGVEVWIDDFGTGQSSLSYLKHLPAHVLKIDKVFVDTIDNEDDRVYLESIARAIRSRRKKIVIEGVASAYQVELLRGIETTYLQGYYFCRPIGPSELRALIDRSPTLPEREP